MVWNIGDGKGGMAAFLCLINKSKVEGIVGLGLVDKIQDENSRKTS